MKGLAAEKIKTGVLEVGGAPVGQTRVSLAKFFTTEATPQLYAWIGDDSAGSGYVGAWFKRILIGGVGPWAAKIIADANGNVAVPAGVITAGTLVAGVVYAGQINTGQVNAGQFVGHTLLLTVNGITTDISNQWDANYGAYAGISVKNSVNSRKTLVTNGGLACINDNGSIAFEASGGAYGSLAVRDQWNLYRVELFGHNGAVRASEFQDAAGLKVVGYRTSGVANPSGGAVVDQECRNALIALLDRVRAHGLIYT
jgi:hypothetical protein